MTTRDDVIGRLRREALAGPLGSRERAELRRQLVDQFGCDDCGAPAGRECYPEYGCTDRNRTIPRGKP